MGRSEPCVLFAQSFVHAELDEYADEVLFAEPVVITACEFLEQNAPPSASNIPLTGATSPPSFAVEIFVHCEGESRFRRLCQPFLYSHLSSNVLEVEAIVTNHLVVRGMYRNLTLVLYGNTAEDLGQFHIELDIDSSLATVGSSLSDGKLEDLPALLHPTKLIFDKSICNAKSILFQVPKLGSPPELKQFLLLVLKMCQVPCDDSVVSNIAGVVVSAVSMSSICNNDKSLTSEQSLVGPWAARLKDMKEFGRVLAEATKELLDLCKEYNLFPDHESLGDTVLGSEGKLPDFEVLVDMFRNCQFFEKEFQSWFQNKSTMVSLGLAFLFCSSPESCFHFVNNGGMEKIISFFCGKIQSSAVFALLMLSTVELATRHSIGCEGFLGWWPRGYENIPVGNSAGYCYLLKLLLEKPRHDVASLATYLLQRLRLYEASSRYESAILAVLRDLSFGSEIGDEGIASLRIASLQLKKVQKLINVVGPIEDPSPLTYAQSLSLSGQSEGLLTYKSTIKNIASSKCTFTRWELDACLLSLLKERGVFPLSAALLSSPLLRSANRGTTHIFMDIVISIESTLLNLLFYRSGLLHLLDQPDATELLILSLQDAEDPTKECMTLRQAAVFLSKGFICRSHEVAMIAELHLKVVIAVDRLLSTTHSGELLWILWELCAIGRTDPGREALLVISHFPEAISVLLDALRSYKDLEATASESVSGTPPLNLAIFHSAAEIFEVLVTDSTASSLMSWIEHAVELHKALHSSSPGSNKKDSPTRLLDWIDAGVVYHKNGAVGLLRYAAVLASGGDAHLSSASILVSDSVDVENVVGNPTNNSDTHIMDNLLGKLVSDKFFEGVPLQDTSIIQLTTAFRILAFISDNSAVAAGLFEEGAMTLIYVVIVSCKAMLERLTNSYDYLVDEGAEFNPTTDLLLERVHEQNLIDLMIPCLLLLNNILKKLHESKEQYRNKRLLNALLHLHREISPKLVACAADLCFPYPSSALGFGAVCHLLTSALACWPIFGWSPGLFHCLLESVQATSYLALGPKDACSILCLLADLFPDEGVWSLKNEIPPLSALRTLSVGSILGPQVERDVNWYLQPQHTAVMLMRLTPQLDRIGQIVLHFAFTALNVIQDMLRTFIIRIACQKADCAVVLLRPIISWIEDHIGRSSLTDIDIFKVYQLLLFMGSLLEHPDAKAILLRMGALRMLGNVLSRYISATKGYGILMLESQVSPKNVTLLSWCLPVLKALTSIFSSRSTLKENELPEMSGYDSIEVEESAIILQLVLKLCLVLPVGRQLLACLFTLRELASFPQGRRALASVVLQIQYLHQDDQERNESSDDVNILIDQDWENFPPLLICVQNMFKSLESMDCSLVCIVEIVDALSTIAQCLSIGGDKLDGALTWKCLFGLLPSDDSSAISLDDKLNNVRDLFMKLERRIDGDESLAISIGNKALLRVKEAFKSMVSLLEAPPGSLSKWEGTNETESSDSNYCKLNGDVEGSTDVLLESFAEKFTWECPDSSLGRQLMSSLSAKRKLVLGESSGKRLRESSVNEPAGSNAFSRAFVTPSVSSGPTRRDTFRQRKPNTSRPPSMHVDDYVARERNIDGAGSGPNIIRASERGGSTSGRPPSIHVDEFMARQRERQNSNNATTADSPMVKSSTNVSNNNSSKAEKPQQLKASLDDDQEIDIVFDEEMESDDRLPFPQPDENLQPPVVIGESSPSSFVEDTDGEANENTRFTPSDTPLSVTGEASHASIPPRRSEFSVATEGIMPSVKQFSGGIVKSEDAKYVSSSTIRDFKLQSAEAATGISPHNRSVSSTQPASQTASPSSFYQRNSPHKNVDGLVSTSYADKRFPNNQPPLPPTPPPGAVTAQTADSGQNRSSNRRDIQPPLPSGYPPQAFDVGANNSYAGVSLKNESSLSAGNFLSSNTHPTGDHKFPVSMASGYRLNMDTFPSGSTLQPAPPLPPLPPPFSTSLTHSPTIASSQSFNNPIINAGAQPPVPSAPMNNSGLGVFPASGAYSLPPLASPMLMARPNSSPGSFFGSSVLQNSQNSSNFTQHISSPQSSLQLMQPRPPPPPPQLPRSAGPIQLSQTHSEQVMQFPQSSIQVQVNPLQIPQQVQVPQLQLYYQPQQQEPAQPLQSIQHGQQQNRSAELENTSQQQNDAAMTLQQYFASPEAIQSLLSDRDKLCQLLEQHPKLMQMLQERLGQQ